MFVEQGFHQAETEVQSEENLPLEPTTVHEGAHEVPEEKEGEEQKAPDSAMAPEVAIPEDETETPAVSAPDETTPETEPYPKVESDPASTVDQNGETGTDDASSVGSYEILEKKKDDKEEGGETVPSASAKEPEVKPE